MQISELVIATPYYVLMDRKTPIGPSVSNSNSLECSAIFGFSDKTHYDNFCSESSVLLTPYPLVKGYLRNQVGISGQHNANEPRPKLVVLDAPGPCEPSLPAATMEAVLKAREDRMTHTTPTHQLIFNPETSVYRLEEKPE